MRLSSLEVPTNWDKGRWGGGLWRSCGALTPPRRPERCSRRLCWLNWSRQPSLGPLPPLFFPSHPFGSVLSPPPPPSPWAHWLSCFASSRGRSTGRSLCLPRVSPRHQVACALPPSRPLLAVSHLPREPFPDRPVSLACFPRFTFFSALNSNGLMSCAHLHADCLFPHLNESSNRQGCAPSPEKSAWAASLDKYIWDVCRTPVPMPRLSKGTLSGLQDPIPSPKRKHSYPERDSRDKSK